jgi:5-formyltetrahydrofolate cyclo-ligase
MISMAALEKSGSIISMNSKPELRKRIRALRDSLAEDEHRRLSNLICAALQQFCVSRRLTRIAAFWPFGSEVDLRGLVNARPDWSFYFPKVVSTSPPRLAWGMEPLEPGFSGLMEPSFAQHFTPPVQLLLVPGLAFDDRGYRLGYGGGFYDALLEHVGPELPVMGVGFNLQVVDHVPDDPHDIPVDWFCTEKRIRDLQGHENN